MKIGAINQRGNSIKESRSDFVFDAILVMLAVLISAMVLYPLIYVVSASFSNPLSITRGDVLLLPKQVTLEAYRSISQNQDLINGFKNTVIITVGGTLLNLFMTICCAYPLSRRELFGNNAITMIITFTMFFSAGMIPNYLLIRDLNLLDNTLSLILPGSISVYNMLIMRNYFQNSIPEDLFGAAKIDGCTNIQTLIKVVLPLSKSIIAVMVIFYAVGHWNAYFDSLLYMTSKDKFPLQLVLRRLLLESQTLQDDTGVGSHIAEASLAYVAIQYAVIVVSSLPVMILYPMLQKYFVQGVMIGAVKG